MSPLLSCLVITVKNIQGEELKKEVEEKTGLLAEAARALESLEAKQAARIASLNQQLDRERADRQQAQLSYRQDQHLTDGDSLARCGQGPKFPFTLIYLVCLIFCKLQMALICYRYLYGIVRYRVCGVRFRNSYVPPPPLSCY
jgi:hypothetical protein